MTMEIDGNSDESSPTDDVELTNDCDRDFSDEEGYEAIKWDRLPPERDFFATPYDPPVKALVSEIDDKELIVRPFFQRKDVWDSSRKSRFIESILLNIPIPTLFFAEDEDKSKVVVDGQQRLLSLRHFIKGEFALRSLEVLSPLNGRRFHQLTERQQRIINNRTLRCLVISARSDSEIRFQVFERLNQGGLPLNAQEVRHCIYRGSLNELLHELVTDAEWLRLYGREEPHPRMVDCELILRFFAIRDSLPGYSPPLKGLLNSFMRKNRHSSGGVLDELGSAFRRAVRGVAAAFPEHPFRRISSTDDGASYDKSLNRAVFDIQMLTLGQVSPDWLFANQEEIKGRFESLCLGDTVFADAVSRATADKTRFNYRLRRWVSTLNDLGARLSIEDMVPDLDEPEGELSS